ncbi:MAG TPA: hypothetical protein VJP58_07240 [Candidatus Nitrosocosmicus sp.]|nr:hypothetical protein [Candidatus Nitrosocosmicus sp.]
MVRIIVNVTFFKKQEFTKYLILCVMVISLIISMSSISLSFPQGIDPLDTTIVSNSKPNIVILNVTKITLEDSATGLTSITGAIQNNSTENVENMKVNVTLFG